MTSKIQVMFSGIASGVFGFIAWLSTVPPEQQSGILAQLPDALPPDWRPFIGTWTKALSTGLMIYSLYKAHAGPGKAAPDAVNAPQSPSVTKLPLVILAGLCVAMAGNYATACQPVKFTPQELAELARIESTFPPTGYTGPYWYLPGEEFKRALRAYEIRTIAELRK